MPSLHCPQQSARQNLVTIFLVLAIVFTNLLAQAQTQCDPAAVWLTLPDSSQVADVNKQLMTDSGPTVNHHTQTTTYSRRWQGASTLRSLSITMIIHSTVKTAADSVKSYGEGLLKSKDGLKVSLGDLGYRTNVDSNRRPYFMVHKGRFVITYYTSYPGRKGRIIDIPAQEKTIREILSKISSLPCFIPGGQPPPPPPNSCPTVKLSFSPTQPLPTDTITLTAKATDADGDKLTYKWEITDYKSGKKITVNWAGSRHTWQPPGPGRYGVLVEVYDGICPGRYPGRHLKYISVVPDPNRANKPPVINLSAKPKLALVGQKVLFTAVVNDPEGDPVGQPSWSLGGKNSGMKVEKRTGNTFTCRDNFTAGRSSIFFSVADAYGARASGGTHILVTDPNQALDVKLSWSPSMGSLCCVDEGGNITFSALANNPKQEPLTYAWSIDGKRKTTWQGARVIWGNVPYKKKYKITVQVWKKSGETASDDVYLNVFPMQPPPPPPTVNSKPKVTLICLTAKPQAGQPVRFKATVSDADAGDKLTWKWSLDGKAVGWSSLAAAWNNSTAGKHNVTITVSDGTDKVSNTKTFTVQALSPPPPPPATTTIIQSAEFVDNATSSVWGSSTKNRWQAGEEIGLRIKLKPVNRSHNLEIIWRDAAGRKQKRDPAAVSASVGWGQGETIWSAYRSSTNDAVGNWTVEIMVDGRLDRTLNFRLDRKIRSISRGQSLPPSRQPGSRPQSQPTPSTSGTGSGGTPTPSSTWKPVF